MGIKNEVVMRLLAAPHIKTRRLMLPASPSQTEVMKKERLPDLHRRFLAGIRGFGIDAAKKALSQHGTDPSQVGVIVTVSSSGLALPGISAILMKEMGLNPKAHRTDVVGMGCNAGLSGLRTLSQLLRGYPAGTIGLLLCVEVCSALYMRDESTGTGIVNSLFGDAAVATVLVASPASQVVSLPSSTESMSTTLIDFESHTFPELFDDMRYDVEDDEENDSFYSFKLSKRIPQAVGDSVAAPVLELLGRHGLATKDINHWVVHAGGAAVMDSTVKNLQLTPNCIRHTRSVLSEYGNISSASFLVSYERLLLEHQSSGTSVINNGDRIVFIAMGPGTTIEVALGVANTQHSKLQGAKSYL